VELEINVSARAGRTVVAVAGEIDAYTAPALKAALDDAIPAKGTRVVVDLSEVSFVDSTGLGALVGGLNLARSHDGTMVLVVTVDRVRRIFELSSLTQLFPLHPSLDDALADGDEGR
jgi:anti-sigma B factor antagonist